MFLNINPQIPIGSTPGGNAEFVCVAFPSAILMDMQILVNGTLLENFNITDVRVQVDISQGFLMLVFYNLTTGLNGTRIGCRAGFTDGNIVTAPSQSQILLQGLKLMSSEL